MHRIRYQRILPATLWVAVLLVAPCTRGQTLEEKPSPIVFFDVTDLPTRIDEPKLIKTGDHYSLNCAVANRSGEQLLGLRMDLIVLDRDAKLRTRVNWNEESVIEPASIKVFAFRPPVKIKVQPNDRLFLGVGEVIGRENIWHVVDGEKALRAYSRGQHDVLPKVQTVANKADPRDAPRVIPPEKQY